MFICLKSLTFISYMKQYNYLQINIRWEYLKPYNCKLFVLRMVTWSYLPSYVPYLINTQGSYYY